MALTIITFTATLNQIELVVNTIVPLVAATLIVTDGTTLNILADFAPTGNANEYKAIVLGNYRDGVFTADLNNDTDELLISIGNLLLGNQYLLDETIREVWDCGLLQNLQGVEQLILANEGDLARKIYYDIQKKSASCTEAALFEYHINKTSVWIVASEYVLV
jgi:hypothetical protein